VAIVKRRKPLAPWALHQNHLLLTWILLYTCKGNTLRASMNICTHLWTFAHSRNCFRNKAHLRKWGAFAQLRHLLRQLSLNLLIHQANHYYHILPICIVKTVPQTVVVDCAFAQTSHAVMVPAEMIKDIFSHPLPIMAWCGHQLKLLAWCRCRHWLMTNPLDGNTTLDAISARLEGAPIILECCTPSPYILRPCNRLLRVFSLDFPCKVCTFLVKIVYSI
jgi:hypothetical protein